mgnify:CR=1 FL=1
MAGANVCRAYVWVGGDHPDVRGQPRCGGRGRVTVRGGNKHGARAVAEPVGADDEMIIDDVDRGGCLAVTNIEFVGANHVGERNARVALENANALEARTTGEDGGGSGGR